MSGPPNVGRNHRVSVGSPVVGSMMTFVLRLKVRRMVRLRVLNAICRQTLLRVTVGRSPELGRSPVGGRVLFTSHKKKRYVVGRPVGVLAREGRYGEHDGVG